MALPSRLSKRLREVLGVEAANDMVTFLEELRSQRAEFAQLRGDVLAAVQRLDDKLTETRVDLAERIANVKADLMKWSFLFWVGAVAAVAMLADVLGR